jgi:hypothetical protein
MADNDETPFGAAEPNDPIAPAPGTKALAATQQAFQQLRADIREGKVAFAGEREDRQAVATIEEGLEAGAEGDESEEEPEGDEAGDAEQGADDAEGGEAEETVEGEEAEGAAEEKLRVTLKGRNPDDQPIEFIAPDEESAERLRQNVRDGLRRDEFNRRVEGVAQREEEIAYVNHRLKHDPGGFITERIPADVQEEVLERLLLQPGMLEKMTARIDDLSNPDKLEVKRARVEADSLRKSAKIDEEFDNDAVARRATRVLMDTCDTLAGAVPTDLQHQFVDDVLRDVQQFYVRENRGTPLTPEEIVSVAAPRLKLYGLTPDKAVGLLKGDPSPIPKAKPNAAAAERLKADAQNKARKLVRASQGRKAAASVAGAGTPPPARPTAPPKGQGLKERLGWFRENVLGQRGRK